MIITGLCLGNLADRPELTPRLKRFAGSRTLFFGLRCHRGWGFDLHRRIHPEELGLAVEEFGEDATGLDARLPLFDGDLESLRSPLDDPMHLRLDDHLAIDVRNDFLDGVVEEFKGLVTFLRRYMVSPGL